MTIANRNMKISLSVINVKNVFRIKLDREKTIKLRSRNFPPLASTLNFSAVLISLNHAIVINLKETTLARDLMQSIQIS
jgi:hypothetical protein